MQKIVEMVYKIIKNYMLTAAMDTGNPQFVAQLNTAFAAVEDAWKVINTPAAPVVPPVNPPEVPKS
jgi:hypothetical protein